MISSFRRRINIGQERSFAGIVLTLLLGPSLLQADGLRDTLRTFDPTTSSAFYRNPAITAQAARFDLPAPGYLRRVTLWLAGQEGATASLVIYGNEAAFAAPLVGQPISRSVTVRKTRNGAEEIRVDLPTDLFIDRPQFFVVLSDLSGDLRWLSDRHVREPFCVDGADRWSPQAIRTGAGSWAIGRHAYAVEAIVEYPERPAPGFLLPLGTDAGLRDEPVANRSIAWRDLDGDTRPELLVGGRLYRNLGDDRFEDMTEESGLPTDDAPTAHLFIDVDNDRDADILALGYADGASILWRNDGTSAFERVELDAIAGISPSSFGVADADADGYLDVALALSADTTGGERGPMLLRNRAGAGFELVELVELVPTSITGAISSVEWVHADRDHAPDLAITFVSGADPVILHNDGAGRFSIGERPATASVDPVGAGVSTIRGVAADWIRSEGDLELLQPSDLEPEAVRGGAAATTGAVLPALSAPQMLDALPYEAFAGAGLWADVDNDGRLDALVTSSCDCRYATLFLQESPGHLVDRSFHYGLFRLPAGADAVWVDYDGDGLLDLSTFVGDRFVLLKNTLHSPENGVTVDASGAPDPAGAVGGTITVHTGDRSTTRTIGSGRGLLMQQPPAVHVGLGHEVSIDSIVYRSRSGEARTLLNPAANRVHRLFDDRASSAESSDHAIHVAPNPFRTRLTFSFDLESTLDARIEVYGVDGVHLATPLSERLSAGSHAIDWTARAADGSDLPAGTYVWRAWLGSRTLTGRSVLVR